MDGNLVMASAFAGARAGRRAVACLLPLLLAGATCARPGATDAPAPERRLKAAYLVRVATYVDWPDAAFARPDSPLVIGIAGDDALAEQAAQFMAGRSVRGHPLDVRRIGAAPPPGLHVLFAAATPARARLLDAVHNQPVLTVCDGAPERRCVVSLVADGDHLRVRIDRLEALAAQLHVSARLLALGTW